MEGLRGMWRLGAALYKQLKDKCVLQQTILRKKWSGNASSRQTPICRCWCQRWAARTVREDVQVRDQPVCRTLLGEVICWVLKCRVKGSFGNIPPQKFVQERTTTGYRLSCSPLLLPFSHVQHLDIFLDTVMFLLPSSKYMSIHIGVSFLIFDSSLGVWDSGAISQATLQIAQSWGSNWKSLWLRWKTGFGMVVALELRHAVVQFLVLEASSFAGVTWESVVLIIAAVAVAVVVVVVCCWRRSYVLLATIRSPYSPNSLLLGFLMQL